MIPIPFLPQIAIGAVAVLLLGVGVQTLRLSDAQDDLREMTTDRDLWKTKFEGQVKEIDRASRESYRKGLEVGQEAVRTMEVSNAQDKPAVDTVRSRIDSLCKPAQGSGQGNLQVPAAAGGASQADAKAEDDRESAFVADLADDIEACASALNQCTAIQAFVKANGG